MNRSCRVLGHGLVVTLAALTTATATAQDAPVGLQFSLSNPGARSLALGGAFAGLADDATAAFANPAGLVQLKKRELMLEGRLWSYDTPYTNGGRIAGAATGQGLDDTDGLRTDSSSDRLAGVSFASFVYPQERWAIAIYRHVSANFETEAQSQGFFASIPQPPGTYRYDDFVRTTNLELVNWGLAASGRLGPMVDVGFGVSYYEGKFDTTSLLYALDDPNIDTLIPGVPPSFLPGNDPGLFVPNSYLPERLDLSLATTVDDADWSFNGGFLVHANEQWHIGGFFRRAPRFDLRLEIVTGPGIQMAPPGTVLRMAESPIRFPDVYGLGFAYRSKSGTVTVVGEWDRVEYSSLLNSLDPDQIQATGAVLEDADELRAGFEYVFVSTKPIIAVRGGLWYDPDHQIRNESADPYFQAISPAGNDELHYTAGLGLALTHWQFDFAVDVSELINTLSASAIFKF